MSGSTPQAIANFLQAAKSGDERLLDDVITSREIDLNATLSPEDAAIYGLPAGWSALALAANYARIRTVFVLLRAFKRSRKNLLEFKTPDGKNVLDLAFAAKQLDDEMDANDQIAVMILDAAAKEPVDREQYFQLSIENDMPSTAALLLISGVKYDIPDVIRAIENDRVAIAKMLVTGKVIETDASDLQNITSTEHKIGEPINVGETVIYSDRPLNLLDYAASHASFEMFDMLCSMQHPQPSMTVERLTDLLLIIMQRRGADQYKRPDNGAFAVRVLKKMLPKEVPLGSITVDDMPLVFLATLGNDAALIDYMATEGLAGQFNTPVTVATEEPLHPIVDAISRGSLYTVAALQRYGASLEPVTLEQLLSIAYEFKFTHSYTDASFDIHYQKYLVRGSLIDFAVLSKNAVFLEAVLERVLLSKPELLGKEVLLLDPATKTEMPTRQNVLHFICGLNNADEQYLPIVAKLVVAMQSLDWSLDIRSTQDQLNAADYASRAENTRILQLLQSNGLQLTPPPAFSRPTPVVSSTRTPRGSFFGAPRSPLVTLFRSPSGRPNSGATSPATTSPATTSPSTSEPNSASIAASPGTHPRRRSSLTWMPTGGCFGSSAAAERDDSRDRDQVGTTQRSGSPSQQLG